MEIMFIIYMGLASLLCLVVLFFVVKEIVSEMKASSMLKKSEKAFLENSDNVDDSETSLEPLPEITLIDGEKSQ